MGRPGRLIIPHSHKPAKASAMCLQWWKQPPNGWKRIPMDPLYSLQREYLLHRASSLKLLPLRDLIIPWLEYVITR
ncbi:hypothetical protein QYF61_006033 [Mycteria americana]|uniref:Uncharacterized protein n=1 Tax=Mycteria americana TaxID=33587 RepID=A0AAN7SCX5_MYCAM|nr:hypothetical protein QYF61_006033 [Mycteria americana]